MLKGVDPTFSAAFLQHPVAGQVTFWLDVDEAGHVTNAHIFRSSGNYDLDIATQQAVMQFVYQPYIDPQSGKPKAIRVSLNYNYHP